MRCLRRIRISIVFDKVMNHYFSTRELSKLCGVGETTVKRWSNMGLIKHHKTVGRHRKFKLEDVLDFISKNHIQIPNEQIEQLKLEKQSSDNLDLGAEIILVKGDTDALAQRLYTSLCAKNKQEVEVLLIRAFEQKLSFATIFDKMIAPAMHKVGNLWENQKICSAEEHVISNIMVEAIMRLKTRYESLQSDISLGVDDDYGMDGEPTLYRHRKRHDQTHRIKTPINDLEQDKASKPKVVVCSCPEIEHHEIALQGVALVCASHGFEVLYVGRAVPFKDLLKFIEVSEPGLVCMSFTTAKIDEMLYKRYEQFRKKMARAKIKLIIGGQFLGEKKSLPIKSDFRAFNCVSLEQFLKQNFQVSSSIL